MIITGDTATLIAECKCCGKAETYEMTESETENLLKYMFFGSQAGHLEELFPKVPAWIRAGAIDTRSNGFCICPECGPS